MTTVSVAPSDQTVPPAPPSHQRGREGLVMLAVLGLLLAGVWVAPKIADALRPRTLSVELTNTAWRLDRLTQDGIDRPLPRRGAMLQFTTNFIAIGTSCDTLTGDWAQINDGVMIDRLALGQAGCGWLNDTAEQQQRRRWLGAATHVEEGHLPITGDAAGLTLDNGGYQLHYVPAPPRSS